MAVDDDDIGVIATAASASNFALCVESSCMNGYNTNTFV